MPQSFSDSMRLEEKHVEPFLVAWFISVPGKWTQRGLRANQHEHVHQHLPDYHKNRLPNVFMSNKEQNFSLTLLYKENVSSLGRDHGKSIWYHDFLIMIMSQQLALTLWKRDEDLKVSAKDSKTKIIAGSCVSRESYRLCGNEDHLGQIQKSHQLNHSMGYPDVPGHRLRIATNLSARDCSWSCNFLST